MLFIKRWYFLLVPAIFVDEIILSTYNFGALFKKVVLLISLMIHIYKSINQIDKNITKYNNQF